MLTDFNFDFRDDDSLKAFAGNTLHALFAKENQGLLPTKVNYHDAGLQLCYYSTPAPQYLMLQSNAGAHRLLSASQDSYNGRRL